MKRFLLFAYADYYPSGGMNDFVKDFDTLIEAYNVLTITGGETREIYDTEKMCIVNLDDLIQIGLKNYV